MFRQVISRCAQRLGPSRRIPSALRAFSSQPEMTVFPGAQTEYTQEMNWRASHKLFPCFRVTNNDGEIIKEDYELQIEDAEMVKMYETMLRLNQMDNVFYNAQRQGRISFYMTCYGEEAIHIGSSAALEPEDMIYAQYREAGVLMWRGWDVEAFAHQLFSNDQDLGKGRQMPVHYGSRELNYHTISSPLGTQIPHAVGAAFGFKRERSNRVSVTYFGDGAASEGDFHAAINFATTLEVPCMFFCRNNGYAISTPVKEQYGGDGIAGRGPAFGVDTIRIDGNDLLAVYDATKEGRKMAVENNRPVLIEAMTYRSGHHSTSDDSTRYRSKEELLYWMEDQSALTRTRMLLERRGLWDGDKEVECVAQARADVLAALGKAERCTKPAISQVFADVYDKPQPHLVEQEQEMLSHLADHPGLYPLDDYCPNENYRNPADDIQR